MRTHACLAAMLGIALWAALYAPVAAGAPRAARSLPYVRTWTAAVWVAQRSYPGSRRWLLECSASEGGHGRWVWNTAGSGAGGWMQYLRGTWVHDWNRASYDLRRRGWRWPARAASWYEPLGQALAAGWAYYHHRPPGKWLGAGC